MINIGGKEYAESPMEGAVLCCTSISPEDRAQLAEYAQEMGAKHTLDLTSDVTHLLVGSTNSEKYRYVAKYREDVKVLLPGWVHAIRRAWMADEVIDLNAMDAAYRCPTLYGLKICITGFEDLDFRNELAKNIAKYGGEYTGDLTKDVTHLIAFTPQGKKYEYAGAWGVKVVSLKWYKDTLDRAMQLDESLYHPAMSPEEQGNGAWNRLTPGSSRLGKRQRPDSVVQEPGRKIRRAASARFSSQNNNMWNDIVGGGPTAVEPSEQKRHIQTARSVANLSENSSLPTNPEPITGPPSRVDDSAQISAAKAQTRQGGFLADKHFAQKGFDEARKSLLFAALAGHGAVLHPSISTLLEGAADDSSSHFLIVPHDISSKHFNNLRKSLRNTAIVTELWLEYCMTVKAFVPPESYALAAPICPTAIPGIANLTVNASGFHQVQTMHIAKTIKKLGAIYQENFTSQTSVLVTNSSNPNQQKIAHATAWKVPVVTEKWLWKLIAMNRIPSFDNFTVAAQTDGGEPRRAETARAISHRDGQERGIKSDNEDSFVEAAKAIETREQQKQKSKRQTEHRNGQERTSADAESQHSADEHKQPARDSPLPLQEISTNVMPRAPRSAKKKLFRQFDGAQSDQIEPPEAIIKARDAQQALTKEVTPILIDDDGEMPPMFDDNGREELMVPPPAVLDDTRHQISGDLLKDFFEVKAAAEARKSAMATNESKSKKKKNLLGRAISNLSNSSRKSTEDINTIEAGRTKQPLSRASSINSVNTDGLGVPLSALSRIPSDMVSKNVNTASSRQAVPQSLTGKANANKHLTRAATTSAINAPATEPGHADMSFHAALATLSTSQLPQPPSPTQQAQLTYAATDEAAKLRAQLAEKRRTRARLGQSEDDPAPETIAGDRERRMLELAREESEEMRQRRWMEERKREGEAGVGMELIRDDERVVGIGRRTRGREKRVSALGGGNGEFGVGDGVFEGM